jgi:dihydrolipoamide dehydrogenase
MVVGEIPDPVDLLVVGGGPGGYTAALRAAELGRKVTLVDRGGDEGGIGGACLWVGCIPSKALIEVADAYHQTIAMRRAGLEVDAAAVNLATFQTWKGDLIAQLGGGVESLLASAGVEVISGRLRFTNGESAAVDTSTGTRFLNWKQALIAVGTRPSIIASLASASTSTDILAMKEIPASAVIVGAGYIGLELGTALAKLGTTVTVVEAAERIAPTIDPQLTGHVRRAMERMGVTFLTGHSVVGIDGREVTVAGEGGERKLNADRILVAVGRTPNTDELGLDRAGVKLDQGGLIEVDDSMLANPRVAAVGDVVAGPALAHKASAEAVVAVEALCGLPSKFEPRGIPMVVFTDPEIASVGLTEAEAAEMQIDVVVGQASLGANGRSATLGSDGMVKVVVDLASERILGLHMVGRHVSELVAEGALALEMIATPQDVTNTIHPHPTVSEGIHHALTSVVSKR